MLFAIWVMETSYERFGLILDGENPLTGTKGVKSSDGSDLPGRLFDNIYHTTRNELPYAPVWRPCTDEFSHQWLSKQQQRSATPNLEA